MLQVFNKKVDKYYPLFPLLQCTRACLQNITCIVSNRKLKEKKVPMEVEKRENEEKIPVERRILEEEKTQLKGKEAVTGKGKEKMNRKKKKKFQRKR